MEKKWIVILISLVLLLTGIIAALLIILNKSEDDVQHTPIDPKDIYTLSDDNSPKDNTQEQSVATVIPKPKPTQIPTPTVTPSTEEVPPLHNEPIVTVDGLALVGTESVDNEADIDILLSVLRQYAQSNNLFIDNAFIDKYDKDANEYVLNLIPMNTYVRINVDTGDLVETDRMTEFGF